MPLPILIVYLFIALVYLLTVFFVIYHLISYSINSRLNLLILPIFSIGALILLLINFTSFFAINWDVLWDKIINFV